MSPPATSMAAMMFFESSTLEAMDARVMLPLPCQAHPRGGDGDTARPVGADEDFIVVAGDRRVVVGGDLHRVRRDAVVADQQGRTRELCPTATDAVGVFADVDLLQV